MRALFAVASALMLCAAPLGIAVAQQSTPSPQAPAAQKPGTPDEETQRQTTDWQHTRSGLNGKQEPKPATPKTDQANDPVFLNGALNVPGADADSQTAPAKYSARNAALDKLPIMAYPLTLNDDQKRILRDGIRTANKPVVTIEARITQELPNSVPVYDLPQAVADAVPGVRGLKYVQLKDKILLIDTPNMVVVGEFAV